MEWRRGIERAVCSASFDRVSGQARDTLLSWLDYKHAAPSVFRESLGNHLLARRACSAIAVRYLKTGAA